MRRTRSTGWWFWALPALACIPCLLLPAFIALGAVLASATGGVLGGVLVAGAILLMGGGLSVSVYLFLRSRARRNAACCLPIAALPSMTGPQEPAEEPVSEVAR
ncbi:MAG TPA: hypothetical protein VKV26_08695 [Dehalococcoidia bacterium]|nr:hypothetical protein [Dehalococcoidia bacterium]